MNNFAEYSFKILEKELPIFVGLYNILGDEVDWVQCDQCELWFHLTCLNLSKDDVSTDDDFVCNTCRKPALDIAAGGDQAARVIHLAADEEIISVVSTPVPSASQSPMHDDNSSGEAGDGPRVRVTSAHEDLENIEITTTIVRPGDCSVDVDVEGDDRVATSEDGDSTISTEVIVGMV